MSQSKDQESNGNDPLSKLQRERERQQQIERLSEHSIVELESVRQFHEWLDRKRACRQACRVIGDSRTGKSVACQTYARQHPLQQKSGEAPRVPVIYLYAPTESSPRELFLGLLGSMQYGIVKGTIPELRERVYRLLRTCGVEMILLDEAHRLRHRTLSEVRDIFDLLGIAVVLVGTDRLNAVARRDEQVYNRFLACHRFHRLDGQTLAETTAIWEEYVLQLPRRSDLTSAPMQQVLGAVTGGYIGLLDEILRTAARRALEQEQELIDLTLLNQVAAEYR